MNAGYKYLLGIIIIKKIFQCIFSWIDFFSWCGKKLHEISVNILFHHFGRSIVLLRIPWCIARIFLFSKWISFFDELLCKYTFRYIFLGFCYRWISIFCVCYNNFHIKRKLMPTFFLLSIVNDCTFPATETRWEKTPAQSLGYFYFFFAVPSAFICP